jgi:4-hydroxymandelate oxidase
MGLAYGFHFDETRFAGHNSGTDMAADLVRSMGRPTAPIDLIVVAQSVPDIDIDRFAACELTAMLPGATLGFGVTDQGLATSFTALRVADAYAGSGVASGVMVVLIDQSTIPFDTDVPAALRPTVDAAVALVFGPAGLHDGMSVRQITDVAPADVSMRLAAELPHDIGTVVLGTGIDAVPDLPATTVTAPPGQPTTGLWTYLAPRRPGGSGRVALVDYDVTLRCLSIASL